MLRATIVSVSEENNKNLINFIATTVETLRDQVETMRDEMVTKADLAAFKDQMVTKKEFALLKDQMATKNELKEDLARLESQMAANLARTELNLDNKLTVIRGDIEQVQVRLDSIDHAVSGRMESVETEISRLKSVLYLLVKDKPEMLRLLGRGASGESRPTG